MRKSYFYMAFLALAFGISGCGDITCKQGEAYCHDRTTSMVCMPDGEFQFETCIDCNFDTGKCNRQFNNSNSSYDENSSGEDSQQCTSGSYKCEDNDSYVCYNGRWSVDEYCVYGCDNNTAKCINLCAPGGTKYCKKTCNATGSEGYYYAKGMVHTVTCNNYDCTIVNDRVECQSGTSGDIPAEVPTSCTKNVSPAICTNNNSVAYFCGSEGTYYKGATCPGYDCVVCPNGYGGCGITCCYPTETIEYSCYDGIDNDCDGDIDGKDYDCLLPCTPIANIECEQCLNVCTGPYGLDGYYCNTRTGIMVKRTCENSCTVTANNRIECQ